VAFAVFGPNIVYGAPIDVMRQQLKFVSTGLTGPVMQAHTAKVVAEVEEYFKPFAAEGTFDMFQVFGDLVIRTACRCLLGQHFSKYLSADIAHLYQDLSDGMNHLTILAPTFPTAKHRARDVARDKMVKLFQAAIQERRSSGKPEDDYLQVLMDAKYKDGTAIKDTEIHGLLLAALFAGQHTSSITSTWLGAHITSDKALL
jgi:sterol 14alpha-demethylase